MHWGERDKVGGRITSILISHVLSLAVCGRVHVLLLIILRIRIILRGVLSQVEAPVIQHHGQRRVTAWMTLCSLSLFFSTTDSALLLLPWLLVLLLLFLLAHVLRL